MGDVRSTRVSRAEYERPPITEVILGVGFEPLHTLLAPHLGLLWKKYQAQFPKVEEKPPLMVAGDKFDFNEVPPLPRVWFSEESGNRLIQVQRDRFLHNWREISSGDKYPRYERIRESVKSRLDEFLAFLEENGLGSPTFKSAEMSYVNHIVFDENISSFDDLGKVFPDFARRSADILQGFAAFNWVSVFTLPESLGVLNVAIRSAARNSDGTPVIVFELNARGNPEEFSVDRLWDWFDAVHLEILNAFEKLTDEHFQVKVWGRK
jgi:uncharacterized protein (TIGR04255 family)